MFAPTAGLLGRWGSKRLPWLKGKVVKGDWRRLVRKTALKEWAEKERRINEELLGADAPLDYTPPPNVLRTPGWLRALRLRALKTKLQPTTDAERLYVEFDSWAQDNPKGRATADQIAAVWAAANDREDLNVAAQVLQRGAILGARLTPDLFAACVDAALRTQQLDVARYLADNHRVLGFPRVAFDDLLRVHQETREMPSLREPKMPRVIAKDVKQIDDALRRLGFNPGMAQADPDPTPAVAK
jgi:hypothetical protein